MQGFVSLRTQTTTTTTTIYLYSHTYKIITADIIKLVESLPTITIGAKKMDREYLKF